MSSSNINSINLNNLMYSNYTYSNTSSNSNFANIFDSVANVPTGRQNRNVNYTNSYTNYANTYNTCNIHNSINLTNTTNTRQKQTEKAIEIAKSHLGGKYVWGATGPDAFDCSGFTQYIYKEAYNKTIPRVSYEQAKFGQEIDRKDLQPGDLVFFDTMNKGRVSHVGIYIGNNKFIHAASSKSGIIESELSGYYSKKYLGARRP